MAMNLDWMDDLCARKGETPLGEKLGRPFNATDSQGKRWRCATDGHALVCVEIGVEVFPEGPGLAPNVKLYLDAVVDGFWSGDIKVLRRHIGPLPSGRCIECKGDGKVECDTCGGDGVFVYYEDRNPERCPDCKEGKAICYVCDGSGQAPLRQVRHIAIRDVAFNASLIALMLRDAPVGHVSLGFLKVGTDKLYLNCPPLLVVGDNWRGAVMPMYFETEEVSKFPHVKL